MSGTGRRPRVHEYIHPGNAPAPTFRFRVVRLWQVPAADFLAGGLGVAPLAVLGALPGEPDEALAPVVSRVVERITAEAPKPVAEKLLTASYILTGLRVQPAVARQLFQEVRAMRDSSTYQAILEEGRVEGRVEEARRILARQGRLRFGPPDVAVEAALQAIDDPDRLEALADRILTAPTWQELLAAP